MFNPAPLQTDSSEELDRACLTATAAHDRTAFNRLYRRHHGRLARFLRRFTARADLIDEALNDTMWTVWQQAAAFEGRSRVSTWITGIAYRTMLRALRRCSPALSAEPLDGDDERQDAARSAPDEDRERINWIRRGMALLAQEQRLTLELAYFHGYSCEEIAHIMDCPVGTVKARMFHAWLKLRNTLPVLGGDTEPAAGAKHG